MKAQRCLSTLTEEATWKELKVLEKEIAPSGYPYYTITVAPPHFSIAKAVRNKGGTLYPVKAEGTIEVEPSQRLDGQTQVSFQFGLTTDGYLIAGILVLAILFGSIIIPVAMKNSDSYPMGKFTLIFFLFPLVFLPFYFFVFSYWHLNELLQTRWKLLKSLEQEEV